MLKITESENKIKGGVPVFGAWRVFYVRVVIRSWFSQHTVRRVYKVIINNKNKNRMYSLREIYFFLKKMLSNALLKSNQ